MTAYKFLIKDIYTNEKREFEHISESSDSRVAHKEGMRSIKYEEDIEKVYTDQNKSLNVKSYDRLVYDKRKGFLLILHYIHHQRHPAGCLFLLNNYMIPAEIMTMAGGSIVGFFFKLVAKRAENEQKRFEMMMKEKKFADDSADKAVQRVGVDAGKWVRRLIVVSVIWCHPGSLHYYIYESSNCCRRTSYTKNIVGTIRN